MKFLKKYVKTKIGLITIAIIVIGYLMVSGDGKLEYSSDTAEIGVIRQVVSETGVVEASEDVTLSFATSGRISGVYFEKGDFVQKGQTIAMLDISGLNAQLSQAEASLERALTDKSVERAETSFDGVKKDMVNILKDTYIIADDAIRNKADQVFVDDGSDSPDLKRGGSSYDERKDINDARRDLKYTLRDWEDSLVYLDENSDFTPHVQNANEQLILIRNYLNDLAILVNKFKPNDYDISATDIDGYQAAISSARYNINGAITSLNNTNDIYNAEKIALETSTSEEGELVTLQNIKIKEARAQVDAINSRINDAIIKSPISGIITNIFYDAGESVSATVPIVSVISNSNFEITVNIPEDDIENINVGDVAEVEFDAYDGIIFETDVIFISSSAEIVDNVPVFEATLQFRETDERIKSGLSVDIDIIAEQKEDVIVISSRAVVDREDGQYVRLINPEEENTYSEIPVVVGTRGENGTIEAIDGVTPGDELITFIDDKVLEKFNKK